MHAAYLANKRVAQLMAFLLLVIVGSVVSAQSEQNLTAAEARVTLAVESMT